VPGEETLMPAAIRLCALLALVVALAAAGEDAAAISGRWQGEVWPIVERHCLACHNADKKKGDLDLSPLRDAAAALRARGTWRRALAQIRDGEMPPVNKPQPTADQRAAVQRWLVDAIALAGTGGGDPAGWDPGPSPVRRLTRTEYERTVRDLTAIAFDAGTAGIPAETGGAGFDTIGAALTLPPVLMERYFAAAEALAAGIVDRARNGKAFALVIGTPPAAGAEAAAAAARNVLERFTRRAWRRPAEPDEMAGLLRLFQSASERKESFTNALRLPLRAVLVAPSFLLRLERERPATKPYRIDDHALAARLAYFLWSTIPDDALDALADAGKLSDPAVLSAQVTRLLADPRAHALTTGFASQWLQLERLQLARPGTEQFPAFTAKLKSAMRSESERFIDGLREDDRSVLDLIDSDYAWVNQDLARHYGLPAVSGDALVRVALKSDQHRGGLLGMGAILAMTSQAHRTSPTLRGAWVLEVIFGTPPPPPPADAGNLKEDRKGKDASSLRELRELLAQHAADPTCAACHRRIDPLGFALENYDAVGAWRDQHGGRPIDSSGRLPDGATLSGVAGLKQVIQSRREEFTRNLVAQVLRYALGRNLLDSDEYALDAAIAALDRGGQRFSVLIQAVVASQPFQYRRPPVPESKR